MLPSTYFDRTKCPQTERSPSVENLLGLTRTVPNQHSHHSVRLYCGPAVVVAVPPPLLPPGDIPPSITSGVSGFILSMSSSTGIVAGGGVGGAPVALVSGVCIGMSEFGGKNACGNFGSGTGAPASIGFTITGVTITMSSVFGPRSSASSGKACRESAHRQ